MRTPGQILCERLGVEWAPLSDSMRAHYNQVASDFLRDLAPPSEAQAMEAYRDRRRRALLSDAGVGGF